MTPVYLDYNATTPVDLRVLDAMLPFLREGFGNPSSSYALGRAARVAVEQARGEVAALIGAEPDEIVFTGGATEATNLALRGAAILDPKRGGILTTNIEHPATVACCKILRATGHAVTELRASAEGVVSADDVNEIALDRVGLATLIHAQNEIGTLQPVAAIAQALHARGILVHTDAAQSVGKIPVDVRALDVDLLTIAGHKLYAPKGIGVLFVRRWIKLPPLVAGADQERGVRPGTENVPYIVALGAACRIAREGLRETEARLRDLSGRLFKQIAAKVPGLRLVGAHAPRLPNTLNLLFPDVSGQRVLDACPGVMASTGSACHAGSEEPSSILTAIGIPAGVALGAVRLSVGRDTTADQIDAAANELSKAWAAVAK